MKRWVVAAVCGLSLLACSPDTSSPESKPADAATTGVRPSLVPGSKLGIARASPRDRDLSVRRYNRLKCFGFRPTIIGTPLDDRIRGTSADDVIMTLGGDDVVTGINKQTFGDTVCTGTGDDQVIAEKGGLFSLGDRVRLGKGDDSVTVHDHVGHVGTIRAGGGDDTIRLARRSWGNVAPGPGDDLISAVDELRKIQTTCVRLGSATGPVRVNLARGRVAGQGRDRLVHIRCAVGSRFNDLLIGSGRDDNIDAGGGPDLVRAGSGNDDVYAGAGADVVHLGTGHDSAEGVYGWDRLYGGPGIDVIAGGEDGDHLDGGTGDDYLHAGYRSCTEDFPGGSPVWAILEGLTPGTAPNEVFGRAGNDFLNGDRGNDRLDGGAGVDSGTGGYQDGRLDWITSLESFDECAGP
jgi:Ca2+-binding RTX toxin-like protein